MLEKTNKWKKYGKNWLDTSILYTAIEEDTLSK